MFSQKAPLKVLSWNVFLRPGIMRDNQMKRVEPIGEYLIQTAADIIILQEAFHKKAKRTLIKKLQQLYPYYTSPGPISFWGVSSGVLIFSKHPLLEEAFISFNSGTGSDKLARKGLVHVAFNFHNKRVDVFGTHLQAGISNKCKLIRKQQVMVLKKASYSVDPSNGLILAGDFNFTPNGDLFAFLKKTLDIEVSVLDSEVKHSANFPDQDLFSVQGNPVWIDFILLRQSQWLEQTRIWIEEPRERKGEIWTRISDHNPITAVFQLTEFEH